MRRTALAPIRVLLQRTSPGTRGVLALVAFLGFISRLAVIATAREVGRGDIVRATGVAIFVGAAVAIQRVVQAQARVRVECDLYRAASSALVDGDVLTAPVRDLQHSVFDGEHHARGLLATSLPGLLSDALACVAIAPFLEGALPARVLAIAALALAAVLVSVIALRRVTQRLHARMLESVQLVYDRVLVAIEGRVELVARGGEEAFKKDLDDALARYTRVANTVSLRSAVVGRLPLVVGAGIVVAAVVLDGSSRDAVGMAILGEALLIASCLPPILGAVIGAHDLVRTSALVSPLIDVLMMAPRPELGRTGAAPPAAPFDVTFEDVTFRYAEDARDVLVAVNARWSRGRALLVEGPNGAGKSTFLRLLLGLGRPRLGKVVVGDEDLVTVDARAMRRDAAYLPQQPYLGEPYVAVRAALQMARPSSVDDAMIAVLDRVGVLVALRARAKDPLAVPVGTLSAGQRQRVALARVLLQDASLVILDEPDAYLDREGVALVISLVDELVAAGKMVAVAAHSQGFATEASIRVALS